MGGGQTKGKYSLAGYENFRSSVLVEIRREAFGEDIGQFSWITADEYRGFLTRLELSAGSVLLDVACGSGGLSVYAANHTGCNVIGLDMSEEAVRAATDLAAENDLKERTRFFRHDATQLFPLEDESVDAIICIDAINHVVNRSQLFTEWLRLLRPGGQFLFTDAVVAAGALTRREIDSRSSRMGEFVFTLVGEHERTIERAGFESVQCDDVTETIASTAQRWHDARAKRQDLLQEHEGAEQFREMQQMLATASLLARERRLLRLAFRARKK